MSSLGRRPDRPYGTLHAVTEPWARPAVTVYLPPGYDPARRYPVLYTADGKAWLDVLHLPTLLDNLIASRRPRGAGLPPGRNVAGRCR